MSCRKISCYRCELLSGQKPKIFLQSVEKTDRGEIFCSNSSTYGFNGQEKDDEVAGSGNSYTAEFWQYDSRLGRRWNQDPKPNPSISNYATFANNPIYYNDFLGDTIYKFGSDGKFIGLVDDGNETVIGQFQKSEDEIINFQFNDLEHDRKLIKNGGIRVETKSVTEIKGLMKEAGVYSKTAQESPYDYADREGSFEGKLDFAEGPLSIKTSEFVIHIVTSGGASTGYNYYDYGNFLTGHALKKTRYSTLAG